MRIEDLEIETEVFACTEGRYSIYDAPIGGQQADDGVVLDEAIKHVRARRKELGKDYFCLAKLTLYKLPEEIE